MMIKSINLDSFYKLFINKNLFSNFFGEICFYLYCVKGRSVIQGELICDIELLYQQICAMGCGETTTFCQHRHMW